MSFGTVPLLWLIRHVRIGLIKLFRLQSIEMHISNSYSSAFGYSIVANGCCIYVEYSALIIVDGVTDYSSPTDGVAIHINQLELKSVDDIEGLIGGSIGQKLVNYRPVRVIK